MNEWIHVWMTNDHNASWIILKVNPCMVISVKTRIMNPKHVISRYQQMWLRNQSIVMHTRLRATQINSKEQSQNTEVWKPGKQKVRNNRVSHLGCELIHKNQTWVLLKRLAKHTTLPYPPLSTKESRLCFRSHLGLYILYYKIKVLLQTSILVGSLHPQIQPTKDQKMLKKNESVMNTQNLFLIIIP